MLFWQSLICRSNSRKKPSNFRKISLGEAKMISRKIMNSIWQFLPTVLPTLLFGWLKFILEFTDIWQEQSRQHWLFNSSSFWNFDVPMSRCHVNGPVLDQVLDTSKPKVLIAAPRYQPHLGIQWDKLVR